MATTAAIVIPTGCYSGCYGCYNMRHGRITAATVIPTGCYSGHRSPAGGSGSSLSMSTYVHGVLCVRPVPCVPSVLRVCLAGAPLAPCTNICSCQGMAITIESKEVYACTHRHAYASVCSCHILAGSHMWVPHRHPFSSRIDVPTIRHRQIPLQLVGPKVSL